MGTQRSQNTHLALFHHCRHNSPCVHRTSFPKVCTGKLSDTCIDLFHTYLYLCNKQLLQYKTDALIIYQALEFVRNNNTCNNKSRFRFQHCLWCIIRASGVVANLELGERWTMEGPKVPSEARRREAPERRRGGVWRGAP